MPYERDPRVIRWFEVALSDERPRIRRRAVELLEHVETDQRDDWLKRAQHDSDPQVVAIAAMIGALVTMDAEQRTLELMESDILQDLEESDSTGSGSTPSKSVRAPTCHPQSGSYGAGRRTTRQPSRWP